MAACDSCGATNAPAANFCSSCGAALAAAVPAAASARKVVTVLFCDVADSTPLGERLDPESLRRVMSRWFEEMRTVLESHGGTVEKFIGDAVMAVFGVPQLHEDDALRATRAAAEMRAALARLNEELARDWAVEIHVRIGVNTGEVVAGDPAGGQTLVTGAAVNAAKRLEQAARTGEILLGDATRRLVENAVLLEPRGALAAKGKAEPVSAWALLGVIAGAPGYARRLDSPLVGRQPELEALHEALAGAIREQECRLLTILGPAGIGKSRLATELGAATSGEAHFVTGRCLPYGDGITFWPLAEIVRALGGATGVRAALEGAEDAELVAERVLGIVDGNGVAAATGETFWAVRRLFEAVARKRPLVVCVEDIHWAQPTFLDLVEYVAGWSRSVPILLLCLARPELLDERPSWLAAAPGLTLGPLTPTESEALLDELSREWSLAADTRARITAAAEGFPLYVEQMVAMVAEDGPAALTEIPPSIQALLTARIDRLEPLERGALERAAVAGKEFSRGAVLELSPAEERAGLDARLLALVRRELIRPERSEISRDDGFSFRHALIRDAAYGGIPKEVRATLHERVAGWCEKTSASGGSDEIVGYHLEQAYLYRAQLGPVDEAARQLAARAGRLLGDAGRRAFARDDIPAARNLLERTVALLAPDAPERLDVLRDLANALWASGEGERSNIVLDELALGAALAGDRRLVAYADLEREQRRDRTDPAADSARFLAATENAIAEFAALGDDHGLARAWRYRSYVAHRVCSLAEAESHSERALRHARAAGDAHEEARSADALCTALVYGPTHVERGIRRAEELLVHAAPNLLLQANVNASLAALHALGGRFERARELYRSSATTYEELGLRMALAGLAEVAGLIELLARDPVEAERQLRLGHEIIVQAGAQAALAPHEALLALALLDQGRHADGRRLAAHAKGLAAADNLLARVIASLALGRAHAAVGEEGHALAEAQEAVALAARTDAINLHADALIAYAAVLRRSGDTTAAEAAAAAAAELYARKGNLVSVDLVAVGTADPRP